MLEKLKELIEQSTSILITSHIGPDGDSISSSLLLFEILATNYPDKSVVVAMEEEPYGLDFLSGYDQMEFLPLAKSLVEQKPDLLFILDANSLSRVTRVTDEASAAYNEVKPKTIIIDHHEPIGVGENDLYINNDSVAVTLDIYDLFIKQLGHKKPDDYAQTALTGIYTDTGGFVHQNHNFNKIFEVIPELIADGARTEVIVSNLNKLSEEAVEVAKGVLANTAFKDDFTYSYVDDATVAKVDHESLIKAVDIFRNNFIRSVAGKPWGFIVYRDLKGGDNKYSLSMRALTGAKDVAAIAAVLGGGGHKPAAGAKFEASSIDEAVQKVLAAIEQAANS